MQDSPKTMQVFYQCCRELNRLNGDARKVVEALGYIYGDAPELTVKGRPASLDAPKRVRKLSATLMFFRDYPGSTTRDAANVLGRTMASVSVIVSRLARQGRLVSDGQRPARYSIPGGAK